MRLTSFILVAAALSACDGSTAPSPAADGATATAVTLDNKDDRASYAIGYDMGRSLKRQEIDAKIGPLSAGLAAALTGEGSLMTDEECDATLRAFRTEQRAVATARRTEQGEANKAEGEAFLAENGQRDGVETTASGLQYEIMTHGDGATPSATDRVSVHYRGTLIDGTEFDSSYSRGQPATFGVSGVIRGWTEALQLMKVGDKYKLFIPGDLAYGPRGSGAKIGPNAVLIFEVELLGIE